MNRKALGVMLTLAALMVLAGGLIAGTEDVKRLPGEDGKKAAISPAPFPDRMSAYVWRNWGLVDRAKLARIVGAPVEDLAAVAVQMGLDPNPVVQS